MSNAEKISLKMGFRNCWEILCSEVALLGKRFIPNIDPTLIRRDKQFMEQRRRLARFSGTITIRNLENVAGLNAVG